MAVDDELDQPHRWYSTNLVGVPAPVLAAVSYTHLTLPTIYSV